MTKKVNEITIDGERLKKAIKSRGMTLAGASEMIGRNQSYIGKCCERGKITDIIERAIERNLSISLGEYIRTKPDLEPASTLFDGDTEMLQKAIFHGVYGALVKLLKEYPELFTGGAA